MRGQWARRLASAGAVGSAILYVGITFGFVSIGSSWDVRGAYLGIGLLMLVLSVLVMDVQNRSTLAVFGAFVAALVVGYLATTGTRTPLFEVWGLVLQAFQLAMLAGIGYLVFAPPPSRNRDHPPRDVLTWKASSA